MPVTAALYLTAQQRPLDERKDVSEQRAEDLGGGVHSQLQGWTVHHQSVQLSRRAVLHRRI